MKSSQWIGALAVLVVMVFVITFAMNFIGGMAKTPDPGPNPAPDGEGNGHNLTFFVKGLPPDPTDPAQAIYHEERKTGALDFLFENQNAEDVKIGLIRKNCKCASVHVVLASPEWKSRRSAVVVGEIVAEFGGIDLLGPTKFAELSSRQLRPDQEKGLQELQQAIQPVAKLEPLGKEDNAVVPGNSLGWIRLEWDNSKTDVQRFRGDLWVGSLNSGMNTVLEAEVHFVPPLRTELTDVRTGELNETALEKRPFEASVRVWSATRPSLKLKTEVVRQPRFDAQRFDPFAVGQPVPLSAEEVLDLKRSTPDAGTVLCAYRIPVKLYGRSPDGKVAVDLGAFRRRLRVVSDGDDGVEPIQLTVTGSVQGSVLIGGSEDAGRLSLGVFDSNAGSAMQTLVLTSQTAGVADLEVDKERTPEFLRDGVRLEKIADLAGRPGWKLRVQVKPNAARGDFPRQDDPLYADSAVYLNVKGDIAQNIRIPIAGTANER